MRGCSSPARWGWPFYHELLLHTGGGGAPTHLGHPALQVPSANPPLPSPPQVWIYDPAAPLGERYSAPSATTALARMYHATALLTVEGDVMVTGRHRWTAAAGRCLMLDCC